MVRFNTLLTESEFAALVRLADTERRDTRAQAAVLIAEGLIERGLLTKENPDAVNVGAGELAQAGASVDSIISAALPTSTNGGGHARV
jgi:hypothetical protein